MLFPLLSFLPSYLADDPLGLFLLVSIVSVLFAWTIILIASWILP
jgi:hypothetical protein